jgi:hypothetical protein
MSDVLFLQLDVGGPDHLAPFLRFLSNEFPEIGCGADKWCSAEVREPGFQRGPDDARIYLGVEFINDLGGRVLRCSQANPRGRLIAW